MNRLKKIEQDKYIKSLLYLFILQRGAFNWWLEPWLFEQVAKTVNCSVHKVKKVFFKDLIVNDSDWLDQFIY